MDKSKMNEAVRKVLKRLHYPIEVMLACVRWYSALYLQADAKCPYVLELERCLLADDLALVPWLAVNSVGVGSHDGLPSS